MKTKKEIEDKLLSLEIEEAMILVNDIGNEYDDLALEFIDCEINLLRWVLKNENSNEPLNPQLNSSSLDKDLVEQRCKSVLEYLFPNYEGQMTVKQYNNAMEVLRSIAFGTPFGKNYR